MRIFSIFLILVIASIAHAQNVHYFRINMGPKMEFHQLENAKHLELLPHVDVGAGFYLGRRFNQNLSAELGILKNDYSVKFQIPVQNISGDEVLVFKDRIYPTYTSYQIAALGSYRKYLSEKWMVYTNFGMNLFLNKKLDQTGTEIISEQIQRLEEPVETVDVTLYSNGFEGGFLIFRGDFGFYRNINDDMAIDFGCSARASNLAINEFNVAYAQNVGPRSETGVSIVNKGTALGIYFGIKYKINDLE